MNKEQFDAKKAEALHTYDAQKADGHFAFVDLQALIISLEHAICGAAKKSHRMSLNGVCFYPRPLNETPSDSMRDGFTGLEIAATDGHALQLCRIPDRATGGDDDMIFAADVCAGQGRKNEDGEVEKTVIVAIKDGIDKVIKGLKAELALDNKERKAAAAKEEFIVPFVSLGTKQSDDGNSRYLTVIVNRQTGTVGLSGAPLIDDIYPDYHAVLGGARAHKKGDSDGLYFDRDQMQKFLRAVGKGMSAKNKESLVLDFNFPHGKGVHCTISSSDKANPKTGKRANVSLTDEVLDLMPKLQWVWDKKAPDFDRASYSVSYNMFLRALGAMSENICLRIPAETDKHHYCVFDSSPPYPAEAGGLDDRRKSPKNPPAEADVMLWNMRPYSIHILMPIWND